MLAACAGGAGIRSSELERAQQAEAAGDQRTAAREYLAAAERARDDHRDHYLLRAAEAYRQLGDYPSVRQVTSSILHSSLTPSDQLHLDLLTAEVALRGDGDPESAMNLLTVPADSVPPSLLARFHGLRAAAFTERGEILDAARERAAQLPWVEGGERDQVTHLLAQLLAAVPVQELYRTSAGLDPDDPLKTAADDALRLQGVTPPRLLAGGRSPMAAREPPPTDSDGRALYSKVVLLLPLTGRIAAAGQAVRDGFFAAYFASPEPRPQIEVVDSGSEEHGVVAAYHQALELGAERVVGPLSREAVSTLFMEPFLPAPVLALNHADGVAPPPGSVQFGLLPDEEAVAAAERLIRQGLLRAGIIALSEDWSLRSAQAFRHHFESMGGEVVQDIRIERGDYDFTRRAESLRNLDIDGLFLAVHAQPARLLVPQLKAAGVGGTWLAMSRVYGGAPLPALDRDLDGLEFSDAPWVIGNVGGVPSRTELASTVRTLQGQALRLFAFGMDAYRLLGYVDWLQNRPHSFISGATGELSVDAARQVRRQLAWARFRDGVPVPVEGALYFGDPQ